MDDINKWGSRKLLVTIVGLIIAPSLPILYKTLGINDQVTITVEGIIATAMGLYGVTNVLAKKYGD